jgi:hypothetical protein
VSLPNLELVESARAFLGAACAVLESQRVIPPPVFHPYIEVGRDYFGPDLMELPEYAAFELAVTDDHPRFGEAVPLGDRDFASAYIFSFLETFVARSSMTEEEMSPTSIAADRSLEDLHRAIQASSWGVACCRVVSHLATADGEVLEIADVRVVPVESGFGGQRHSHDVIESVIPGAESAYARVRPFVYAPPESVVVAEGTDAKPFDQAKDLSARIERFLLLVRLLHAGTCESIYEVQGETCPVRRFKPTVVRFRGSGETLISSTHMLRRSVRLSSNDDRRIDGLWKLIASAERERPGMALTSFAMAVQKFQLSYHSHTWYEQLVDLATAFEAALSGKENADVLLRLRSRSAALLWTDRDPATAIFRDVGQLYSLRSSLVHGGELKEKDLLKAVRGISTVPAEAPFGVALGHVVDRLRDLVRRSLLVRICLAKDDEPIWRLGDDDGVDAKLADDRTRSDWRAAWHDTLTSFDALNAADRPREAVDFISPVDG